MTGPNRSLRNTIIYEQVGEAENLGVVAPTYVPSPPHTNHHNWNVKSVQENICSFFLIRAKRIDGTFDSVFHNVVVAVAYADCI